MKKTIILITIFIIFLISCKVTTTAPENEYLTTANNNYKSSFPILGKTYLWVIRTTDQISLKFGADTAPDPTETGEIIYDAATGITNTMLSTDKNNTNTYAFQTGTLTGSVEVLDTTRVKVYFTQNVNPYIKVMEAVCETTP